MIKLLPGKSCFIVKFVFLEGRNHLVLPGYKGFSPSFAGIGEFVPGEGRVMKDR